MMVTRSPDCLFTGQLGPAVHVQWAGRIAFEVRGALGAVENIIGREVNHQRAKSSSVLRENSWGVCVDRLRRRFVALGTLNIRVGGGIYDQVRANETDRHPHLIRATQIRASPARRHDIAQRCKRPPQLPSYLAGTTQEKD